jgi:hypothetical protein
MIGQILTDIRIVSNYYGGTVRVYETETIKFWVEAEVVDPQGFEDLESIYFYKNDGRDRSWELYDARLANWNECHRGNSNVFACLFHDPQNTRKIDLQGWELAAIDKAGNISTKPFNFALPGGAIPSYEEFVYSEHYTGPTEIGVPALPSLSACYDAFVFTRAGSLSFEFRFSTNDHRVKEYSLELWGFDGIWNYIGDVPIDSPSITSAPVVPGIETRVFIPWSEMVLHAGYAPSDVAGFHIVLYDDLTEVEQGYYWVNHLGVSEFLNPDLYLDRDLYPGLSCN